MEAHCVMVLASLQWQTGLHQLVHSQGTEQTLANLRPHKLPVDSATAMVKQMRITRVCHTRNETYLNRVKNTSIGGCVLGQRDRHTAWTRNLCVALQIRKRLVERNVMTSVSAFTTRNARNFSKQLAHTDTPAVPQ
jgi:hypothetical protein